MKHTPACKMEGIVEMFSEEKEASLVRDAILDVDDDVDSLVVFANSERFIIPQTSGKGFIVESDVLREYVVGGEYAAYLIEPFEENMFWLADASSEIRSVLENVFSKMPRKVAEVFRDAGTEVSIVKYSISEATLDLEIEGSKLVLKPREKPGGKKFSAKVVKAVVYFGGSFCCPMSTYASELLETWKRKYPKNPMLKLIKAKNYEGYKSIDSSLTLKIIVDFERQKQ